MQGPGAIHEVGALSALRHQRAAVLIDSTIADLLEQPLTASLGQAGVATSVARVSGEVTENTMATLAESVRAHAPDVVIAAGGGKTLDIGKGVSMLLRVPVITVPTIASNDGPTSRLIAQYDEQHRLIDTPTLTHNPEAVVVDSSLVSAAPARFLRSGIGDALAKKFEVLGTVRAQGQTSHGSLSFRLPVTIASECFETILRDGVAAVASLGRERVSEELENVIEAVVLMSGLAFENGGLSVAHALTRGLMITPGADRHLHGYHVAYGLLVQLQLEGEHIEIARLRALYRELDLPCSLADLGANSDPDVFARIARATLVAPHSRHIVPAPTEPALIKAMCRLESEHR
ncbi:glycerol dehydrogenase [Microbacterium sp. LRZ72]|uniref:glycerol dehydrogenase n=1 Tax=Microbacterium sp. LRZ72 TaxID=2942481 RepID=UPI0029BC3C05|nr:glycerol dehydrogenase [Microbacterium sp. LRZ72]MDX2376110.1 glycerol dehydrogenase [Microbacterium sp. LRZ72]